MENLSKILKRTDHVHRYNVPKVRCDSAHVYKWTGKDEKNSQHMVPRETHLDLT